MQRYAYNESPVLAKASEGRVPNAPPGPTLGQITGMMAPVSMQWWTPTQFDGGQTTLAIPAVPAVPQSLVGVPAVPGVSAAQRVPQSSVGVPAILVVPVRGSVGQAAPAVRLVEENKIKKKEEDGEEEWLIDL